jgi:hypothetical protein
MNIKKSTKQLNPLEEALKEFLKDQEDYGRYLEDLRKKDKLPEPKDMAKGGSVKKSRMSGEYMLGNKKSVLVDKPLDKPESIKEVRNLARHILYKRNSYQNGGSVNDRIKELEYIIKITFPLIKDFETADIWEKAKEELKLLKEKK